MVFNLFLWKGFARNEIEEYFGNQRQLRRRFDNTETMNQVKTKKLCFGYFYRFVTSALTLQPRSTYIYVFRALFSFCNSLLH